MTATGKYDSANLECDLVMKGGITSGVVYPLALCVVAEKYRLRNIGGASAGAIAAVAAGAAEYGRTTASDRAGARFEGLEKLPELLTAPVGPSRQPRLLSLFQPTDDARPAFRLLLTAIDDAPSWRKALRACTIVFAAQPHAAVLGLILAALLIVTGGVTLAEPLGGFAVLVGALALLLLGVVGSIVLFAWRALEVLGPGANYGICSGAGGDADAPALTEWLTDVIDKLAGVDGDAGAITFGELAKKDIHLSLMTTDLTHLRPFRLPFGDADGLAFFFKKSDFERLFPANVVAKMIDGATPHDGDYYPFPDVDHLPLVVGARMSLSFPVLLQAVPLYAIDWTLKSNRDGSPVLERCWFSDGGICSNLPIHFFDALLPGRPTFALSLKDEHPDYPVVFPPFAPGHSERDNVWLPKNNSAGTAVGWNRFDQGAQAVPLLSFLGAMVDTMQTWNDNLTIRHPGYRDRIVHISHTADEGGMNLNMPEETIKRLAQRGAAAGQVLTEKFNPATGDRWSNHLWVRYRVLLAMLSGQADAITKALDPARNPMLLQLFEDPPSYRFEGTQKPIAENVNTRLVQLASSLGSTGALAAHAPHPPTDLRGRPRSG